jgi:hypothetical protein
MNGILNIQQCQETMQIDIWNNNREYFKNNDLQVKIKI